MSAGTGATPARPTPLTQRALPVALGLLALWPLGRIARAAVEHPVTFARNLVEGVSQGGVYALIALGYTMVYGVLGLINFAHSDVFMVGAYVGIFAAAQFGVTAMSTGPSSPLATVGSLAAAMLMCALLGVTIERFAYRPVRHAPKLTPLVTAIGVSMLLQNLAMLAFTSTPRGFPPLIRSATVSLGGVGVNHIQILNLLAAVSLMAGLHFLVQRTRTGKAMRAISTNIEAAKLMGIPTDRVITATFALGSALAGAGGILFGLDQPKIDPVSGVQPGLKAFVAAVLGGIGNIPGAMLGGLLIGLVEQLASAYLSSSFAPAIVFSILVAVLLVRPQGLMGRVTREKV